MAELESAAPKEFDKEGIHEYFEVRVAVEVASRFWESYE